MKKMQPIGEWLKGGFSYVLANCLMLGKAVAWSFLLYFGIFVLTTIVMVAVGAISKFLGLTLNWFTGILAVVGAIAYMLLILATAGKMIYFLILSVKKPIHSIRESYRKITLRDGGSLYFVLLLSIFAGYTGLIFLIIPGFIIFTWVAFSLFVRTEQGIGGVQSLMVSRDYVRGYFWPLLGRFSVLALLLIAPIIAASIVGVTNNLNESLNSAGILPIIGLIIYFIISMFTIITLYRLAYQLYVNLVDIKGKLELKTTKWRTIRWSLLAYSPLVLSIFSVAILMALNPAAQIQKANEYALQNGIQPSPSPYKFQVPSEKQQQYILALGAVTSKQNGENIDTLRSSHDPGELKSLVAESWDISDRASAKELLDWLIDEGHRTGHWNMSQFLLRENVTTCAGLDNPPDNCRDGDVKAIHDFAQDLESKLAGKTIAAWDYGRLINIARWSYTLDYITEEEAWTYMLIAAKRSQVEYKSWEEYGQSYLLGRGYWLQDLKGSSVQSRIVQNLMSPEGNQAWSTLDWNTKLD